MQSHMPSSDTNLHHLTTKGLLLICGAHSLWRTAWHAEGIMEGEKTVAARITHTSLHTFSHQHRYTFVLGRVNQDAHTFSLSHAKKTLHWCCPCGSWNSRGWGAERDKYNGVGAHYSLEERNWKDFHLCWARHNPHKRPNAAEANKYESYGAERLWRSSVVPCEWRGWTASWQRRGNRGCKKQTEKPPGKEKKDIINNKLMQLHEALISGVRHRWYTLRF